MYIRARFRFPMISFAFLYTLLVHIRYPFALSHSVRQGWRNCPILLSVRALFVRRRDIR